MCLKNECGRGCENNNLADIKCAIAHLCRRVEGLERKVGALIGQEDPAQDSSHKSKELPWFITDSPEAAAKKILVASGYIFDGNVEVSSRLAGTSDTIGLEFHFKVFHTDKNSSILAEESFFCPLFITFEDTVKAFDTRCGDMHAIRLRHEDDQARQEADLRTRHQTPAAKPVSPQSPSRDSTKVRENLYSSRVGKELLIRNSKYAISPARMKVGKACSDKKGRYVPITFFSEGKVFERKSETVRLYVDREVTHDVFDKLVASLKVVKFNLRKPAKASKKGGK